MGVLHSSSRFANTTGVQGGGWEHLVDTWRVLTALLFLWFTFNGAAYHDSRIFLRQRLLAATLHAPPDWVHFAQMLLLYLSARARARGDG